VHPRTPNAGWRVPHGGARKGPCSNMSAGSVTLLGDTGSSRRKSGRTGGREEEGGGEEETKGGRACQGQSCRLWKACLPYDRPDRSIFPFPPTPTEPLLPFPQIWLASFLARPHQPSLSETMVASRPNTALHLHTTPLSSRPTTKNLYSSARLES